MVKVCIRADGGENLGMGHIMRCLSLAQTFRQNGHKVYFLSKLDEGIEKAGSVNFKVFRLPVIEQEKEGYNYGNPAHLGAEACEIITFLNKHQTDILLIDSYNVNEQYFLALKPHVRRLAYIDDLNKFPYPVDIVINGNITGEYSGYRKYYENQVLLLGPRYNLIRAEFCNLPPRTVREKVAEIMITTGGSDTYNITGKLLSILLQNKHFINLRFNILVGSGFNNWKELIGLRQSHHNVFLYANSALSYKLPEIIYSEVSAIMLRSDLAISAGGSTLYELAACGIPTLALILADNQEGLVCKMDELGYVMSLGWYHELNKDLFLAKLREIINAYQRRQEMSAKGQKLVDGKGPERIVRRILRNLENKG